MNIGAGRVVMQDLPRLNASVKDGSLAAHPDLITLAELPTCPSGSPTSAPDAARKLCGWLAISASNTGVLASATALCSGSVR
jgi:hypothetical protein